MNNDNHAHLPRLWAHGIATNHGQVNHPRVSRLSPGTVDGATGATMTAETVGYILGVVVGIWAWYRLGKYAYVKLRS